MHGEDLLVNDGSDWQAVETIGKGLPQLDVISSLAFVVETVDSVDRGALVVTAEDKEVFRVFDLVGQEQADGLEGLLSTVDVVTKEEVVCLWWEAAILEKTEKVVILAMDITTNLGLSANSVFGRGEFSSYLYRCFQLEKNGLRDEDLASLGAQIADFSFEQLNLLSGSASANFQQSVDDGVEIHLLLIRHYSRRARHASCSKWRRERGRARQMSVRVSRTEK